MQHQPASASEVTLTRAVLKYCKEVIVWQEKLRSYKKSVIFLNNLFGYQAVLIEN